MPPRGRRAPRLVVVGFLALTSAALLTSHVQAASGPTPDASCAREHGLRSLNDGTTSVIDFVNETPETLQTFWLNFSGSRVFYRQIPAGTSYTQRTWITHPWIVADLTGTCLKLYVTAARTATVIVSGGAVATSPPTTPGPTQSPETTSTPDQSVNPGAVAGTPGNTSGTDGSGPPTALIIAIAAAVAAAAAAGLALTQGWIGGKPPGGGSPPGYDLSPTPDSQSPTGYGLSPSGPSTAPTGYDAPAPGGGSPAGYDTPAPGGGSPAGYDSPAPGGGSPPGYE